MEGIRVVLAGGGTGGHIFPALALAEELRAVAPGCELLFMGTPDGLEKRLVGEAGGRIELIESVKVQGWAGAAKMPLVFLRAFRRAGRVMKEFRPDVVVATGGYAALVPGLAARQGRIPLIVLEQNAIPGRTSRLLSLLAADVYAEFYQAIHRFPQPRKVVAIGNPVRRAILDAAARRASRPPRADGRLTLLVAGGSQGARRLNEIFLEAAARLGRLASRLRVVHLAGADGFAAAQSAAHCSLLEIDVRPFEADMASLYAEADLAVSRAGATALAELAVCGVPAVLVPFPHAKDNHQEANARCFERAGAAVVLPEAGLTGERLAGHLAALIESPAALAGMALSMKSLGRPEAGQRIASRVVEVAVAMRSMVRT